MKYYEVDFQISCSQPILQDVRDIVSAMAAEAGFETFEETDGGLRGYVQQSLFDRDTLDAVLAGLPFDDVTVAYQLSEAEDRDWNEQWEQQGFDPIIVGNDGNGNMPPVIVIHDGRHLQFPIPNAPFISIEIDAHLAFGTGNHETTRMMIDNLRHLPLQGKRVLDCGCGTGILAITALKLGANEAVGYDIDEWSVDNARHNAVINLTDNSFTPVLGDASVLNGMKGNFDVVVANINRNILLNDMQAFRQKMSVSGILLLSGFYTADVPLLQQRASALGLSLIKKTTEGEWAACVFTTA
jgi:ribosomal protein L11 methyltransferase